MALIALMAMFMAVWGGSPARGQSLAASGGETSLRGATSTRAQLAPAVTCERVADGVVGIETEEEENDEVGAANASLTGALSMAHEGAIVETWWVRPRLEVRDMRLRARGPPRN